MKDNTNTSIAVSKIFKSFIKKKNKAYHDPIIKNETAQETLLSLMTKENKIEYEKYLKDQDQ